MLVLRRKAGEAIVLNGVITIHVLAVEGERVKLGISAPPEVVIVRSELLDGQDSIPGAPSPVAVPAAGAQLPREPAPAYLDGMPVPTLQPGANGHGPSGYANPGRSGVRRRLAEPAASVAPNPVRYR
jgi:carbon storage regulator